MLFRLLACHKRMLLRFNCDNIQQRRRHVVCLCSVLVNFHSLLRECIACQGDQLRDAIFKKQEATIKCHFTVDTPSLYFLFPISNPIHPILWISSYSIAAPVRIRTLDGRECPAYLSGRFLPGTRWMAFIPDRCFQALRLQIPWELHCSGLLRSE
jgi:hypothetical protein